jgi:flagellar motor component MotA
MSRFYPVSVVLTLAVFVAGALLAGGQIGFFLSGPSLAVVLIASLFLSLSSSSPAEIGRHFAVGFKRGEQDPAELERALFYFDALGRYLVVSGLIGTVIGAIAILGNPGDVTTLGRGTALALTTLLYGALLWLTVVVPFRTGIRNKLSEHRRGVGGADTWQ